MIYLNGEEQELKHKFIANGAKAPDFTITTSEMKKLHLSDFKKYAVVADFAESSIPFAGFFNKNCILCKNRLIKNHL